MICNSYGIDDIQCSALIYFRFYAIIHLKVGDCVKVLKLTLFVILIVMIVLPVISYIGIVITNNTIADNMEKELVAYDLPPNTELVDSISISGKLTGNGNGMQYMAAILVDSKLSEEELAEYYSLDFDYIEVRKQETANIDFIHNSNYNFKNFSKSNKSFYYSVTCWDDDRQDKYGNFISSLLDFDIRGH